MRVFSCCVTKTSPFHVETGSKKTARPWATSFWLVNESFLLLPRGRRRWQLPEDARGPPTREGSLFSTTPKRSFRLLRCSAHGMWSTYPEEDLLARETRVLGSRRKHPHLHFEECFCRRPVLPLGCAKEPLLVKEGEMFRKPVCSAARSCLARSRPLPPTCPFASSAPQRSCRLHGVRLSRPKAASSSPYLEVLALSGGAPSAAAACRVVTK